MAPREDADLKNAGDLRQPTLRLRVDVAAAGHAAVGVGIETVEKDVAATAGKSGYRFEEYSTEISCVRKVAVMRDGHFTFVVAGFRVCLISISNLPYHR